MRKRLVTIFIVLSLVLTALVVMAEGAFAASATTSISVGSSVTIGSTVTVTVKVSGSKLYAVTHEISYDPDRLEYKSSTATQVNGDGGTLKVLYEGDISGKSSISYELKFKAKKTGKANVTVTTAEICDSTGDDTIKSSPQSASVTIIDKAASNDATLKSLSVSKGSLDPAFSKNTTEYTVKVGNDVTQFLVTPKANNPDATVKVTGSKQLAVGENTRSVTVTAPSGDTKTYNIKIIRAGGNSSQGGSTGEDVTKNINITIGDEKFTVVDDLTNIALPDGFVLDVKKYDDKDIPVIKSTNDLIVIVYLQSAKDGAFITCFYDENSGKFQETSFMSADDVFRFAHDIKALADSEKENEPQDPSDNPSGGKDDNSGLLANFDSQTMFLLIIGACTLLILLIVVICLQVSIIKKRKRE